MRKVTLNCIKIKDDAQHVQRIHINSYVSFQNFSLDSVFSFLTAPLDRSNFNSIGNVSKLPIYQNIPKYLTIGYTFYSRSQES
jgi:hypothetical protein